MREASPVSEKIKSVSAARSKPGPHTRAKKSFRGHNVIWRRITAAFDEDLKKFGANPAMVAPLSRWVLFNHLTRTQGGAGRRYTSIVRAFERYHVEPKSRSPRSPNLEPSSGGEDQELERRANNGTLYDYEHDARDAKRQYKRAMKVLDRFADPLTGRNYAKDMLDMLCLSEQEPPAQHRKDLGSVLSAIAKEFGIGEPKGKVQ